MIIELTSSLESNVAITHAVIRSINLDSKTVSFEWASDVLGTPVEGNFGISCEPYAVEIEGIPSEAQLLAAIEASTAEPV